MNNAINASKFVTSQVEAMQKKLAEIAAAPTGAPRGLPGTFYNDREFFEYEVASVLRDGWHCVGREDEIAKVGDYITVRLVGEPIIIVRDESGIKALSNVCRHRGMPLVEGVGNTRRFVCSYHAWMYSTDGSLLRAARMKNDGFDPKSCKLGEFHCIVRFGFIYVYVSDTPPDFDVELDGLDDLIGRYEPENYRLVHSATEIWNTNWKCLVENFMEGYHLSVVHPETLHGYTPTGLARKAASGKGFTSYYANYPEDTPPRGKGASGLTPEERHRSTLFSVFPCQVVSIAASLLVSLSIRPLTSDSIQVKWTMSVYGDELDYAAVKHRIKLWEDVNTEDREKLERMQMSFQSMHANGGPLAEPDYEGTVHDFLLWLNKQNNKFSRA